MDRAHELVRTVVRGFYDSEHIVALDALVNHVALTNEDFRIIFANTGRQNKDIQKILNHLRTGGLITDFVRPEQKQGAQKPTSVQYWYIDYRRAIDTTKYRLYMLESKLNANQKASEKARMDYICPRCKSEFSELDVLDSVDPYTANFVCKKCKFPKLEWQDHEADEPGKGTGSDSTVGVFNKQFSPIVRLLRQIDEVFIPHVAAETAIAEMQPVPRTIEPSDFTRPDPMETKIMRPTAVKGLTTGPEKVEVTITTDADNVALAAAAEAERKRKKEANAVPEWYTHSTVTNDITAIGAREEAAKREREDGLLGAGLGAGADGEDKKGAVGGGDESLDSFYAALEAEKAQEAQRRAEEDDDDEEDEFEDVNVDGSSAAVATPASITDADHPNKRLKVEAELNRSAAATPAQDSDDEDDFEDA